MRGKTNPSAAGLAIVAEKMADLEKIMGNKKFVAGNEVSIADISIAVTIPILKAFVNEEFVTSKLHKWYECVLVKVPELKLLNDEAYDGYMELKCKNLSATSNC